jgi:membrane associated rhomboid family serine protease
MKLDYNVPVLLTFVLLAVIVQTIDTIVPGVTANFFSTRGVMSWSNPLDYFRLVSHVVGHGGWEHLMGNMMFLLLLGPMLEEKYGSDGMLMMIGFTAIITGIINNILFNVGVAGASGIVFLMIILSSLADVKKGTIPLTFIIVFVMYLGKECLSMFKDDNISQASHIIGGIVGSGFGFSIAKK